MFHSWRCHIRYGPDRNKKFFKEEYVEYGILQINRKLNKISQTDVLLRQQSYIRNYIARILNAWTSFYQIFDAILHHISHREELFIYVTDISIPVSTNAYITFISFSLNNLQQNSIYDAYRQPCLFKQSKALFRMI